MRSNDMNKRRAIRLTALAVIAALILQAGVFAYSKVVNPGAGSLAKAPQTTESLPVSQVAVQVAAALGATSGPAAASGLNLKELALQSEVSEISFEQFIKSFGVQDAYRTQIEEFQQAGYKPADICTAYDFLYQQFGSVAQWKGLLSAKASGQNWETIFTDYLKEHPQFKPRSFDSDELESLLKAGNFISDDIMIGDRLSFVTGKAFKDLIAERIESGDWSRIFEREQILYSGSPLPRVQITVEQMTEYTLAAGYSEEQVAQAFVLAEKVGEAPGIVIAKLKQGSSEQAVMAESYLKKYAGL